MVLDFFRRFAIIAKQRALPVEIWTGIEVVITGLTRNQFEGNLTWVRIPPCPPKWKTGLRAGFLLCHIAEENVLSDVAGEDLFAVYGSAFARDGACKNPFRAVNQPRDHLSRDAKISMRGIDAVKIIPRR